MGRYYNPPEKVREIGRKLEPAETFDGLFSQLRPGEQLFGLYDSAFLLAPLITSQEELERQNDTWRRRKGKVREFYGVPID